MSWFEEPTKISVVVITLAFLGSGFFVLADTASVDVTVIEGGANDTPAISNLSLNGASNITPLESAFVWASSTMTITDTDGCDEVATTTGGASVSATLYHASTTNSGTLCSYDGNNCYPSVSCVPTSTDTCVPGGADSTVDYECGFKLWYIANPTDSGAPRQDDIWSVAATATDKFYATTTATNTGETIDVTSVFAHNVVSFLDYGTSTPNTDTGTADELATTTNTGNRIIYNSIGGDDMCISVYAAACPGLSINYDQQRFSTSSAVDYSLKNHTLAASSSPATIELELPKPTSTTTPVYDLTYWGIAVPNGQATGTYMGLNLFNVSQP